MFTKSNTNPDPSALRAQTGWEKGWKESAQQSKGVLDPGWGASALLKENEFNIFSLARTRVLTP